MLTFKRILKGGDATNSHFETAYEGADEAVTNDHKDEVDDEPVAKRAESIEEHYGDHIIGHYVVRDERRQRFRVYEQVEDLHHDIYVTSKGLAPSLHEVALAGVPRKLHWDIDFTRRHMQELEELREPVLMLLLAAPEVTRSRLTELPEMVARDWLALEINGANQLAMPLIGGLMVKHFMRYLRSRLPFAYQILCTTMHDEHLEHRTHAKFSCHIICGAYGSNSWDVQEWANDLYHGFCLQDDFAACTARFIDMGVYKSIQNFRLAGCIKFGATQDKVKRIITPLFDEPAKNWRHTLITHVDHSTDWPLGQRIDQRALKTSQFIGECDGLTNQLPDGFSEILSSWTGGFRVAKVQGNLVRFIRVAPSLCTFCNRVHDHDNTLFVVIGRTAYVIMCTHDATHKKVFVPIKAVVAGSKTAFRRSDQRGE